MARRFSPYYVDEGRYGGVGQAIGNLGQMFADSQNPNQYAQSEQAAWGARLSKEKVDDLGIARGGRNELADTIAAYDPQKTDPRSMVASMVRSNSQKPKDMGELFRVIQGNLGGSDDQRAGAHVGAGGTIGKNDAFSIADRNKLIDLDSSVMSRDQVIAQEFLKGGPDAAQQALGSLFAPKTGRASSANDLTSPANIKRMSDLEKLVLQGMANIPGRLGDEDLALPEDARNAILDKAMRLVREGVTPAQAVAQSVSELDVRVDQGERSLNPLSDLPWGLTDDPYITHGAEQSAGTPTPSEVTPSDTSQFPTVTSGQQYQELPPGTWFFDRNGDPYKKP